MSSHSHGSASGTFKRRKIPYRARHANTAKVGRKRFYNRPPPGGDYGARVRQQKRYIENSSVYFTDLGTLGRSGQTFPPFGQKGEVIYRKGKGSEKEPPASSYRLSSLGYGDSAW